MNDSQKTFVSRIWFQLDKMDKFSVQEQTEIFNHLVAKMKRKIEAPQQLAQFKAQLAQELAQIDAETAARNARLQREKEKEEREAIDRAKAEEKRKKELEAQANKIVADRAAEQKAAEEAANAAKCDDTPDVDSVSTEQ